MTPEQTPAPASVREAAAVLETVMGKNHAEAVVALTAPGNLGAEFTRFALETCFGNVWSRPGLSLPFRSVATIAVLMALRQTDELKTHMRGALNLGLSVDQLEELILHCSAYLGIPAGGPALKALNDVVTAAQSPKSP
jgi:4-carboxymuconolactone decarboxylase